MKALLYTAPAAWSVAEVPVPEPGAHDALIRVHACGFCKTDLHIHQGHFFSAFPLIPGHEFAGEVAAVGGAVTRTRVGARVTADNQRQCGVCDACRGGRPLFCQRLEARGVNAPGGFAEYVLVHESRVYPLADNVPLVDGTMAEPIACAVHGMDVIAPRAGDEVLLMGAGPTGLVLAQLLRRQGAATLAVCDLSPRKLALASRLAGAETFLVDPDAPAAHLAALRRRAPRGFDIVIDATGVARVAEQLPALAADGGKVVFYGVCPEEDRIAISPYEIFRRQLTLLGSFAQADTFARATRLLNGGAVQVHEMITHHLPLEAWGDALRMATAGGDQVKVVLTP